MDTYFDIRIENLNADFCYSRKPSLERRDMHPYHEILYYLDGDATFICERFRKRLAPKTLLIIPREHYHYFQIDSPESFERLKISIYDDDEYGELIAPLIADVNVFESLDEVCSSVLSGLCTSLLDGISPANARAMATGALLTVLSRLDCNRNSSTFDNCNTANSNHEGVISQILRYIDANLSNDISTESIAKHARISPSSLSHMFKDHLGVSLKQFIIQKRLMMAQRLISNGNNPTDVFMDCGYRDYSSFYKAYVKTFGTPPSNTKSKKGRHDA